MMMLLDAERRGICHSRENGNPEDWIPDLVGDDNHATQSIEELHPDWINFFERVFIRNRP